MKTPLVAPLVPITPDKYETPMMTIMSAFDELLASNKSGQVVEASGPNLYYTKQQTYPDEIAKWVWDDGPAFRSREMAKLGSKLAFFFLWIVIFWCRLGLFASNFEFFIRGSFLQRRISSFLFYLDDIFEENELYRKKCAILAIKP
jgi:hypothetical protein